MNFNNTEAIKELEYNSQRPNLTIPEYGRHLHKLIINIKNIKDKEKRNIAAKETIRIMGTLNPHLRDVPDFQHKLWDQLFQMADFDLDVDSPYPIPTLETIQIKPAKLNYPQQHPKYKYYGNNIIDLINEAVKWEDNELKTILIRAIATQMKKNYLSWNKETVEDEVIFEHLKELSDGKINLFDNPMEISSSSELIKINKKQDTKFNIVTPTNQNRNNNQKFVKNNSTPQHNKQNNNKQKHQ